MGNKSCETPQISQTAWQEVGSRARRPGKQKLKWHCGDPMGIGAWHLSGRTELLDYRQPVRQDVCCPHLKLALRGWRFRTVCPNETMACVSFWRLETQRLLTSFQAADPISTYEFCSLARWKFYRGWYWCVYKIDAFAIQGQNSDFFGTNSCWQEYPMPILAFKSMKRQFSKNPHSFLCKGYFLISHMFISFKFYIHPQDVFHTLVNLKLLALQR